MNTRKNSAWSAITWAVVSIFATVALRAQTDEMPPKPDPIKHAQAQKFSTDVYNYHVKVVKAKNEVADTRIYLAEMAEDPAVFLKEKATTDFQTVVKAAKAKYAQSKKSVDDVLNDDGLGDKIVKLYDNVNDLKKKPKVMKNLGECQKKLVAMPATISKLTSESVGLLKSAGTLNNSLESLGMFERGTITAAVALRTKTVDKTAGELSKLTDVSAKTLAVYKKLLVK